MNKTIMYSILDGIIQGLLLELLLNYLISTMWDYSVGNVFILIVFIIISFISAFFLLVRTPDKLWKKYMLSSAFFIIVSAILFVNKITLKIRLFPISQREASDAEGILFLAIIILFLLLLIIERVFGLIWRHSIK